MNHYQVLGVNTTASQQEIKNAYRGLVKRHHPDLNPSPDSHSIMQAINEAYEVLSEFQARNLYDLTLSGYAIPIEPAEETEAERYRKEFKRKKAHEERVSFEKGIKLKVKFYRAERWVSYVFFVIGLLFTVDYFIYPTSEEYTIRSMDSSRFQTQIAVEEGHKWLADWDLLKEYKVKGGDKVRVAYSAVFKIPARVRLSQSDAKYRIYGTLHSFRNIITLIILTFSAIVIRNEEYTDFRLTCGLVPLLLVIFQLLMVSFGNG